MHAFQAFGRQARSSQAPATAVLTVAIGLAFVISWFSAGRFLGLDWMFLPEIALQKPWTMLTYQFASVGDGRGLIWLVFLLLWLWGLGGSLERDLGTPKYVAYWFVMTFLGAAFHWIGFLIAGGGLEPGQAALFGAYFPVAAVTLAWGTRNPNTPLTLMFVLPIVGKWLALLAVLLVFFGTNSPMLAVFAVIPLGLAYLFAADRLPLLPASTSVRDKKSERRQERRQVEMIDRAVDRKREREERERLRKLFESSLADDPEDKR